MSRTNTSRKPKASQQKVPRAKPKRATATPQPETTPQIKPQKEPKAKKDNIMRKVFISKVVVNMSLGVGGETLAKAKTILENLTGQKPTEILAKATNRDFGLRKGEPMGCKVTLRGERAKDFVKRVLDVKDFELPATSVDSAGNVSFGISEHIQIPGVRYDPDLGIFGMDLCICIERPGYRVNRRRRGRHRIPQRHRISPEESMSILSHELGVQFMRPELEEE